MSISIVQQKIIVNGMIMITKSTVGCCKCHHSLSVWQSFTGDALPDTNLKGIFVRCVRRDTNQ